MVAKFHSNQSQTDLKTRQFHMSDVKSLSTNVLLDDALLHEDDTQIEWTELPLAQITYLLELCPWPL